MKRKKINKILVSMILLSSLSVGLFVYQNFYLNKNNENVIVYVAKDNITTNSTLTSDMFKPINIPKSGVLESYVTNINEVIGKQLRGGLLKEEPLTKTRLTTFKEEKYNLEMKIEADVLVPIKNNDYINIYVVLKDSQGKVELRKVFDTKQVFVEGAGIQSAESSDTIYKVKATEEELTNFYDARERGKIIIAKNTSLDGSEDITDKKYDPNSDEAKNSIKTDGENSPEEGISIVEKKIEEGDTLETLAVKYKTTEDDIKKLNNGKTEFKVGDSIVLPAN